MKEHTATYSPEDDKIRIYPAYRLPKDEYQVLKFAGFGWAPKQECFYAVWTPHREETALQFADEISDEDKSLVERAEERAERFEDYSEKRADDAERAHAGVAAIADNIPLGQPVLVGHHSERRARKDAERIENGMKRAVKMWETAEYWERRAAGALAHAKYKELPGVRHRRIKGLEADKRKQEKTKAEAETFLKLWTAVDSLEKALKVANYDYISRCFPLADYPRDPPASQYEGQMGIWSALDGSVITWEQAQEIAMKSKPRIIAHCVEWINHIDNRLAYERAMLQEAGGLAAEKWDIKPGGRVLTHHNEWVTVVRVNKANGAINSVTTNARYVSKVGIEKIKDYQPPTEEQAAAVKAVTAKAPICNYPGRVGIKRIMSYMCDIVEHDIKEITQEKWDKTYKDYKGTRDVAATETVGAHRVRYMLIDREYSPVFITDAKRKDPPHPDVSPDAPKLAPPEPVLGERPAYAPPEKNEKKEAIKESLKTGVQVVSAPQLFPTPPEIAEKMVEYAEIDDDMNILEPSAGTGNLIAAVFKTAPRCFVLAYEINASIAAQLNTKYYSVDAGNVTVQCDDFLTIIDESRSFDRVIMNPPFQNGDDIKHIKHALTMLKPGGTLVALCANGPRQQAALQPLADHWEVLPAGSFKEQGTNVNVALLVIRR